jgi:uncharacterized membrane protein
MKKTALVISIFLVLSGSIVLARRANAQQILPLTVIPPKQEMLINPGESYSTTVKFENLGTTPVSGAISVLDFIVTDTHGTPVFLDNPQVIGTTTIPEKYSAAKWIKLYTDRMTISANDNVSLPITINVPKNAAPGGRYAAVLFAPVGSLTLGNPTSAGETPISVRIASLLYIRVAGPITEKATVVKFQAPTFLEYGPVSITTEILNQGDYHITPQGSVSITNMFGRVVSTSALDTKNIFPGTSRDYVNSLGEKLMFGKFTVTLAATYGDLGQPLTSTLTMWIFPWKTATAILLAIIIIILLIVMWYKKVIKKEAKLVEQLKEEKTELETLKEKFKDGIKDNEKTPKDQSPPTPPTEKAP